MGKKRRYLTNPKKFGKKHFEILDNMDGTDDNIISSDNAVLAIRTLGLVANNDRTISLTTELFGSGSDTEFLRYKFPVTGGVAVLADIIGSETCERKVTSTGYQFTASLPANASVAGPLRDASGNIFVLPTGKTDVLAAIGTNFPDNISTPANATTFLQESVTVSTAPIGVTSTLLDTSLSSTGALTMSCTAGLVGTGPQHGSGSGVGSSQVYSIASAVGHGFHVALSGNLTGSLTLSQHSGFATTPNYHGSSSVVLLASASVAALAAQTLTVTFTPLDVNGAQSTSEAVSTTMTVPFT
jgi:hypothetical protein